MKPTGYRAIAEFYDFEYADKPMLRHDVPFFLGHLPQAKRKRPGRQRVLELAVGTARAAIPIAQAGHQVVGVDYDRNLLAIARRKRDAVGLGEAELSLRYGDIRSLDLGRRFDWVCLFFNTFLALTTLKEQDKVLQAVTRHLTPAGHFWLDIFQPNLSLLQQERVSGLDAHSFYVPPLDRTVMSTTSLQRDNVRQKQRVTFHYSWFTSSGIRRRLSNTFELTWMFSRELQLLCERNGLRIVRLYGNYDASPLAIKSPRIIACCEMM